MPLPPRRTTAKLIRLHPEELARIAERARACGRTPARFIRETALGAIPKARQHGDAESLLYTLAGIGNTLEQLASVARRGQSPALVGRIAAALDDHRALVEHLLQDRARPARQSSS
jgi:hypothetical protein